MSQAASPTSVSYHTTTFTASFESFNRGPITTLFVPPTTCNQLLTSAVGTLFLGHFGPNYFDPACYPAGTIPESSLEVQTNWGLYYYSPAICPSDWLIATSLLSSALGDGGSLGLAISLGTNTSAAVCCPTGYEYYAAPAGHQCASSLLSGQTVLYFSPTQAGTSEDRGAVTTSSVLDPTQIICDGIPIWWQASDAAVLSAASDITSAISSLSTTTA